MSIVPAVKAPGRIKVPTTAERTLDNGLRVVAVRTPGLPLAELRLRIPLPSAKGDAEDAMRDVLSETVLQGTARRPGGQVAADLRLVGGALSAACDADAFSITGSGLSSGLPELLDVLADVLVAAEHPKAAVLSSRERLAQEISIARTIPGQVARTAISRRAYGSHPYSRGLPSDEVVTDVKASKVRALHRSRIVPTGSVLVVVSDLTTRKVLDTVERALAGWTGSPTGKALPPLPTPDPGPLWLVDRPGAVQSNLRLAGAALARDDEGFAALRMAATIYGGYFTSRLVSNIREDKGWTYSPGSAISLRAAGPSLAVQADVATGVTAAALWETLYELGRIATVAVGQEELDTARQYVLGTTALSLASQAGLASTLAMLLSQGLDLGWLEVHRRDLLALTRDDLLVAAARHLAPAGLVGAVVGDASAIGSSLRGITTVADMTVEA